MNVQIGRPEIGNQARCRELLQALVADVVESLCAEDSGYATYWHALLDDEQRRAKKLAAKIGKKLIARRVYNG